MAMSRKSILAIAAAGLLLGACATGPYYDDGYAYGPYGNAPGPYYSPGPYYGTGPYYDPGYVVGPSVSFGFAYSDRHYDHRRGRH